jgi:hypothetical protein
MKTAILIHGCHLQAEEWENIVWRNPRVGILGRIPRGIQLAIQEKADLIFWGTGASEKDGLKEAEDVFRQLRFYEMRVNFKVLKFLQQHPTLAMQTQTQMIFS